jgi:UDP-2,3-diacylglucosamine hydrolase
LAEGVLHQLFTKLIRNGFFLKLLHIVTLNFLDNRFLKRIIFNLKRKKICNKIENFDKIMLKKTKNFSKIADIVVEGHYHQGVQIKDSGVWYINLPSFECNKSFFIVKYGRGIYKKDWKRQI